MKISNETKVGALTVVAVLGLVLGYNLLRGRNLFTPTNVFYTKMSYNPGLVVSTEVDLDGFKVGTITDIEMTQGAQSEVIFEFTVSKKIKLSRTAIVASFSKGILGGTGLKIYNGDINGPLYQNHDTIPARIELGMIESLTPTLNKIKESLNSFINKLDSTFTKDAQKDLNVSIANIKAITENVKALTLDANALINSERVKLDHTMANVEAITKNIKDNNADITASVKNLKKTTDQLAEADLKKTVEEARKSIEELKTLLNNVNSGKGSLGMLATDRKLYDNLNNMAAHLDSVMKQLERNPGKYIPLKRNKEK